VSDLPTVLPVTVAPPELPVTISFACTELPITETPPPLLDTVAPIAIVFAAHSDTPNTVAGKSKIQGRRLAAKKK
jgi:hypothetical protein